MSTNAHIHMYTQGRLYSIYCHYDGYELGVGQTLYTHYNTPDKVKDLINLGDISTLGAKLHPDTSNHTFGTPEKGVTVAYGRDRGESHTEAEVLEVAHNSVEGIFKSIVKKGAAEYEYLYVVATRKWYVMDPDDKEGYRTLAAALGIEEEHYKLVTKKLYITKEKAVGVSRTLRLRPDLTFVVTRSVDGGGIKTGIVSGKGLDKGLFLYTMSWADYVTQKQGRPTQKELAEIIYLQLNTIAYK